MYWMELWLPDTYVLLTLFTETALNTLWRIHFIYGKIILPSLERCSDTVPSLCQEVCPDARYFFALSISVFSLGSLTLLFSYLNWQVGFFFLSSKPYSFLSQSMTKRMDFEILKPLINYLHLSSTPMALTSIIVISFPTKHPHVYWL